MPQTETSPKRTARQVLVTGVNGFIGRHLESRLRERGWQVRVLSRDRNIADALPLTQKDPHDKWATGLDGLDAVVHLAGIAHQQADAASYRETNTDWPVTLFRAAASAGVTVFVHLSTLKVLGDVSQRPFEPRDQLRCPGDADLYTRSKIEAEQGIGSYESPALRATIIRPPLVYGPGVRANFRALLDLALLGRRGLPLPLGGATAPRSLVSVDNLCGMICAALGGPAGTYHVRDVKDWSVAELLRHWGVPRASLLPVPPAVMHRLLRLLNRPTWFERLYLPLTTDQRATLAALDWRPESDPSRHLDDTLAWRLQSW